MTLRSKYISSEDRELLGRTAAYTFAGDSRLCSGLDCLTCAESARQRYADRHILGACLNLKVMGPLFPEFIYEWETPARAGGISSGRIFVTNTWAQ